MKYFALNRFLIDSPDVLSLTSCGNLDSDISNTRKVRIAAPDLRIVMFGDAGAERKFLQYVRAGIHGYLLLGASVKEVWEALEAVHAGKACCPSSLCGLLFDYFEREATSLPSGAVRQQLGLTWREQQWIPLIAQGRTSKEIANRFCLLEQTVKNHLYRMKHKVGADNRLGIVHCHTQGFLLYVALAPSLDVFCQNDVNSRRRLFSHRQHPRCQSFGFCEEALLDSSREQARKWNQRYSRETFSQTKFGTRSNQEGGSKDN